MRKREISRRGVLKGSLMASVLAAIAVLTAGITGQAELDWLGRALGPRVILFPRPEEAAGAADDTGHQAALQNTSP